MFYISYHNHWNGQFTGACHFKCNLFYSSQKEINIIFHNLQNYDSHFFFRHINEMKGLYHIFKSTSILISFHITDIGHISVIAKSIEKFITFRWVGGIYYFNDSHSYLIYSFSESPDNTFKLTFKDSLNFLGQSLDKLVITIWNLNFMGLNFLYYVG